MRRTLLILGILGSACTASATAEELEMLEAEAEYSSLRIVPDAPEDLEVGPPLVEDVGPSQVRIVVSRYSFDEDPESADGTARCPFTIRAVGFPAIRDDGGAIANLSSGGSSVSEGEDEDVTFTELEVETGKTFHYETLVQGTYDRDKYDCWRWHKQAKAKAAEINETLADGWRPMRELPVEVDPRLAPYPEEEEADERPPANERAVQLTLLNDEVVFRVPGVKVLSRTDEDWWQPEDDDPDMGMCQYDGPNPQAVFADEETGVTMIVNEYMAGSCMCDTPIGREIVRLDAETIAEIDRRGAFAQDRYEY